MEQSQLDKKKTVSKVLVQYKKKKGYEEGGVGGDPSKEI